MNKSKSLLLFISSHRPFLTYYVTDVLQHSNLLEVLFSFSFFILFFFLSYITKLTGTGSIYLTIVSSSITMLILLLCDFSAVHV